MITWILTHIVDTSSIIEIRLWFFELNCFVALFVVATTQFSLKKLEDEEKEKEDFDDYIEYVDEGKY